MRLMRLDTRAFAIAAGATAGVLFTFCALAVAAAPGPTTTLFGYLIHLDLTVLARPLTFVSFVTGLVAWTVGTGVAFAFAASLYNRLIGVGTAPQVAGRQQPASQHA